MWTEWAVGSDGLMFLLCSCTAFKLYLDVQKVSILQGYVYT
jgi:hypothetical protein